MRINNNNFIQESSVFCIAVLIEGTVNKQTNIVKYNTNYVNSQHPSIRFTMEN